MSQTSYDIEVLADSPVVFWKLNDVSGNPVDSSGNSRDATSVTGSPTYHSAGPFAGAFSLFMNGGVSAQRSSVVTAVTDNFTIEGWFKTGIVGADQQTVVYNGNGATNGWGSIIRTAQQFQYLCGGVDVGGNSTGVFSTSAWRQFVALRRAGTWEYWFDGVADSATPGTTVPGVPLGDFGIGSVSLQGWWSNFSVYNTALSGARILAHYNSALVAIPIVSATLQYPSSSGMRSR